MITIINTPAQFNLNEICSLFLDGTLTNVKILSKSWKFYKNNCYYVEILERPAQKVIKL